MSDKLYTTASDVKRYPNIDELKEYLNVGRNKALYIGTVSGAKIKLGRRCVYDVRIIDDYLESVRKAQSDPLASTPSEKEIIARTKEARSAHNKLHRRGDLDD